jgi:monofunctional biosynthetic peptidoglycan transglycosylase
MPMRTLRYLGLGLAAGAAVGFAYLAYLYLTLPDVRPLIKTNPSTTAFIEIRTAEARAAGRAFKRDQRWVPYARISSHLRRAVLVTEDATFFEHDGIDFDELEKSIELNWRTGQFLRGGSTITQQLAKNLYLSPSKNPLRKIKEFLITRRLEAELSKGRILEIYLNVIEWGDGIFGVEAASRRYFGIPAGALGPEQSAMLAAVIMNPRRYLVARPTPWLLRRQKIILQRMGAVEPPPAEESLLPGGPPAGAVQLPPEPEPGRGEGPGTPPPTAATPAKPPEKGPGS